jgi:hypothetical protein
MDGKSQEAKAGRKYDFQAFPENVELARQIEQRLTRRGKPAADAAAAIREIADVQRYMTELYADVRAGAREAVVNDCLNIATSAFVISLILAPDYYRETEGASDPAKFVKKMGDSIALNEIDLDLGTGRWSTAADLIIDMLSSLSVLTGTLAIEAEGEEGYVQADMDFNVLTGSSLIAAYALIVCQCAKNGSYRGQVLKDLKV